MKYKSMAVFGATSGIAQATVRKLVSKGVQSFVLVARNETKLEQVAQDLRARGAEAKIVVADLDTLEDQEHVVKKVIEAGAGLESVLIAYGMLGDQQQAQKDWRHAKGIMHNNYLSCCLLLEHIARHFEEAKAGLIVVLSSVAGDRGRQSNYIYGSAKAGVTAYLQGLRNRLYRAGVRVLTIKPGVIDTPMTQHLDKRPLLASPDQAASGIIAAIAKGRDVVYVPGKWALVMAIIRAIPEFVFKRLSL